MSFILRKTPSDQKLYSTRLYIPFDFHEMKLRMLFYYHNPHTGQVACDLPCVGICDFTAASFILRFRSREIKLNSPLLSETGIVIGKVQSGKTSNFISVLSLAFDNGYDIAVQILIAEPLDKRLKKSYNTTTLIG